MIDIYLCNHRLGHPFYGRRRAHTHLEALSETLGDPLGIKRQPVSLTGDEGHCGRDQPVVRGNRTVVHLGRAVAHKHVVVPGLTVAVGIYGRESLQVVVEGGAQKHLFPFNRTESLGCKARIRLDEDIGSFSIEKSE